MVTPGKERGQAAAEAAVACVGMALVCAFLIAATVATFAAVSADGRVYAASWKVDGQTLAAASTQAERDSYVEGVMLSSALNVDERTLSVSNTSVSPVDGESTETILPLSEADAADYGIYTLQGSREVVRVAFDVTYSPIALPMFGALPPTTRHVEHDLVVSERAAVG